jgi:hypothetical protein
MPGIPVGAKATLYRLQQVQGYYFIRLFDESRREMGVASANGKPWQHGTKAEAKYAAEEQLHLTLFPQRNGQ